MPGLLINGREVVVPGLTVLNASDNPVLRLRVGQPDGNNDGKMRARPISLIVLHTTKGIPGGSNKTPQRLRPGLGAATDAGARVARYWSTDARPSGAHLVVDADGTISCLADLQAHAAYHAGQSEVNERSIGIEIFQDSDASLWEGQLQVVVQLVDFLCLHFGIQRQIPHGYFKKPVPRLQSGGRDVVGVVGHRDVSDQRGFGDPGDFVFDFLAAAGYERFDLFASADLAAWQQRQETLRAKLGRQIAIDGIPGPATVAALKELGYAGGLWTLPPRATYGAPVIESILDGFYPLLVAQTGGDTRAALETVKRWAEARIGKS